MSGCGTTVLQEGMDPSAVSVDPCLGIPALGAGEDRYQHKHEAVPGRFCPKILAFEMNFFTDESNKQPFYAIHHFC